jgi:hypothetical protein
MANRRTSLVAKKNVKSLVADGAKRAKALLETVKESKARIAREFYAIGLALRELLRKKLYASVGCRSFAEMLDRYDLMGKTQAFKLIGIVDNYDRKQALALGLEKAGGLVELAHATAAKDTGVALAKQGVVVRGHRRAVAELSAVEIEEEAKRTRRSRANATRDPARHAAQAIAAEREKELRARGVVAASVEAWKGKSGWMVRVECRVGDLGKLLGE